MPFEDVLLAAHLLAVLTMLVSLITDWFGVHMLRDATTAPQAREGLRALTASAAFGVWGRLGALAAGLWLAVDAWNWQGWIIAGITGWTMLVLLGEPLTGKDLRGMVKAARQAEDDLPAELAAGIHDSRLWTSVATRTGVMSAVVACMTGKPDLIAGLGLLLAGYLMGLVAVRLTATRKPPHAEAVR